MLVQSDKVGAHKSLPSPLGTYKTTPKVDGIADMHMLTGHEGCGTFIYTVDVHGSDVMKHTSAGAE